MNQTNKLFMDLQFFGGDEDVKTEETSKKVTNDVTKENEDLEFAENNKSEENASNKTDVKEEVKDKPTENNKQSKEQNAYYKQKRLEEKEERQKAIEKAKYDGSKEALFKAYKGKNPYTNEPLEDDVDYKELMTMIELEEKGSEHPELDYRTYQKKLAKEQLKAKSQEEQQKEFIQNDIREFKDKYGDKYDIAKLIKDEDFLIFCGEELGKTSISNLVERYSNYTTRIENKYKEKLLKEKAVDETSVGSLKGTNANGDEEYFTLEQIENMSQSEVNKNLDKVNKSLAFINKKH